ncbi:MAG: hypothetical protein LBN20_05405 [Endomicrobium sp.]|jgi:hypothetical protein|nr:hypothetical protein [Endomicrobium sp.]
MYETLSSIKEIVEIGNVEDIKQLKENIANFKCHKDLDVESFLINKSFDYDACHRTRTFLCYDGKGFLSAYFSLTIKVLQLQDYIPKNLRKKLTFGLTSQTNVPAFLIAQMGKDDNCQIKNISAILLNEAQKMILFARHTVAGRIVYLECKNNYKLRKLYEASGFMDLQMNGDLAQMVKII